MQPRYQKDPYIIQDPEKVWEEVNDVSTQYLFPSIPRKTLIWHPCYYIHPTIRYQCARILVPLNYSARIGPSNHAFHDVSLNVYAMNY
ncbi:hypothetical protein M378DRAFT_169213 [Amanita muscaria Koide BX008]|uniref:Uncharacterized protein n=1 Tax=Amanita muscaria (strain Koide BX008) TaxID=946122 RepID=A0A0C2WTA0_AMAMK|nr:hypothetical protein M378DRAFT_169213 [Amanita muscaria Koide BX008]